MVDYQGSGSVRSDAHKQAVEMAMELLTCQSRDELAILAGNLEAFLSEHRLEGRVAKDFNEMHYEFDGHGPLFDEAKTMLLRAELGASAFEQLIAEASEMSRIYKRIAEKLPETFQSPVFPEASGWRISHLVSLAEQRSREQENPGPER